MSAAAAHCSLCCSARAIGIASSRLRARSFPGNPSPATATCGLVELRFLVALDVVLEVNSGIEGAVRLLRPVLEIDLCERQAHGLHLMAAAVVLVQHAGDDHIVHLDDEDLLLTLAGLAVGDRR